MNRFGDETFSKCPITSSYRDAGDLFKYLNDGVSSSTYFTIAYLLKIL